MARLLTFFLIIFSFQIKASEDRYSPLQVLSYHFNSSIQWNSAMRAMHDYPVWGNEKVLHANCKDGSISAFLAKQLPEGSVLGVDSSSQMIRFAKIWYSSDIFSNLNFEVKSLGQINFKEEFDTVYAFSSLGANKDRKNCAKNIFNALKYGGKVVLTEHFSQKNDHFDLFIQLISTEKWQPYFENYLNSHIVYSPLELDRLLRKSGFCVVNVQTRNNETQFDDFNEFREWLWPMINMESEADKNAFLDDYIQLVESHYPAQADGKITVFTTNLQAVANKVLFDDTNID